MKHIFAIAIGICMLATAGAAGTSSQLDTDSGAVMPSNQVNISQLTVAQRKALQDKFRYYPASSYNSPRSPI